MTCTGNKARLIISLIRLKLAFHVILLLSQLLVIYGVDDSNEKIEVADVPGKRSFICKTWAVILDPCISGVIAEYNWFVWLTPLFMLFLFSCLTSTVFTD